MYSTYIFYKKSDKYSHFESFIYNEDERKWQYLLKFH